MLNRHKRAPYRNGKGGFGHSSPLPEYTFSIYVYNGNVKFVYFPNTVSSNGHYKGKMRCLELGEKLHTLTVDIDDMCCNDDVLNHYFIINHYYYY